MLTSILQLIVIAIISILIPLVPYLIARRFGDYFKEHWKAVVVVGILVFSLPTVSIATWNHINQPPPSYEMLISGKIKLERFDLENWKNWFLYEFDVLQETNLTIKTESQVTLLWLITNSTKESIKEGAFNWGDGYSLYFLEASRSYKREVLIKKAGTYVFILFLPSRSSIQTLTVDLQLYIKNPPSNTTQQA